MIENRSRLEKQIFLGRQSVRRAMQSRGVTVGKTDASPQERAPLPVTSSRFPVQSASSLQVPQADDSPLPMDTDQETLMISRGLNGRRASPSPLGSQHHYQEPGSSRASTPRRRMNRTSYHGDDRFSGDYGAATPDPPPPPSGSETDRAPPPEKRPAGHHPPGLFRRLSKSSLRSAFNSLRRPARASPGTEKDREPEQTWSEDSSSDDDDFNLSHLPRRRSTMSRGYPSALELRTELADFQAETGVASTTMDGSDDEMDARTQVDVPDDSQ